MADPASAGRGAGPPTRALLAWAQAAGVLLTPALGAAIEDGFGTGASGEDQFDAVVGLFGMLNVVLGRRRRGEPEDERVRHIEGWTLGQAISRGVAPLLGSARPVVSQSV